MTNNVIKVEGVSKQYRLGTVGTGTLSHDLNRWWHKVRGKEDPYLMIGEENDRSIKGVSDYVWSLRNISFNVQEGDVIGIIGKNGAGKSTLLKILSRTTSPTTGSIKIKGRVASLLEVGTGFHPELSGRDNIYLNGAILGMTKHEISRKFDEIVDFAGVERYVDTPVKRYSSGMYVRLAFAVAAHLEPEILIVDEVLAVGDAEFQKKAIGKMQDVSRTGGRTVLFVSHNMAAVKQLCTKGILLENGQVVFDGYVNEAVEGYLNTGPTTSRLLQWNEGEAPGNDKIKIRRVAAYAKHKSTFAPIKSNDDVVVEIEFDNFMPNVDLDITWDIFDSEAIHVCHVGTLVGKGNKVDTGSYSVKFIIPKDLLNNKRYHLNVLFGVNQQHVAFRYEDIINFDVEDAIEREGANYSKFPGVIHPKLIWESNKITD